MSFFLVYFEFLSRYHIQRPAGPGAESRDVVRLITVSLVHPPGSRVSAPRGDVDVKLTGGDVCGRWSPQRQELVGFDGSEEA